MFIREIEFIYQVMISFQNYGKMIKFHNKMLMNILILLNRLWLYSQKSAIHYYTGYKCYIFRDKIASF